MVHSGLPPCPNFHGLTRLPPSLLPLRPDGKGVRVREREREDVGNDDESTRRVR